MKSPEELTDLYRQRGLKVTPQRQSVFRALDRNMTHPTADAVHELVLAELPTISLRTVYSTLHELSDMGEIGELAVGAGAARFDPNVSPHHHLVCEGCAAVVDVAASFPSVRLADPDAFGFEVSGAEIVFRGLCQTCRAADDEQYPGSSRASTVRRLSPAGPSLSQGDVLTHD